MRFSIERFFKAIRGVFEGFDPLFLPLARSGVFSCEEIAFIGEGPFLNAFGLAAFSAERAGISTKVVPTMDALLHFSTLFKPAKRRTFIFGGKSEALVEVSKMVSTYKVGEGVAVLLEGTVSPKLFPTYVPIGSLGQWTDLEVFGRVCALLVRTFEGIRGEERYPDLGDAERRVKEIREAAEAWGKENKISICGEGCARWAAKEVKVLLEGIGLKVEIIEPEELLFGRVPLEGELLVCLEHGGKRSLSEVLKGLCEHTAGVIYLDNPFWGEWGFLYQVPAVVLFACALGGIPVD